MKPEKKNKKVLVEEDFRLKISQRNPKRYRKYCWEDGDIVFIKHGKPVVIDEGD